MSNDGNYKEIGRVHVVTMQHVDGGETETVTKVGVNEEPVFRSAVISKKVAGVTVRVLEQEDNSVKETGSTQFASKKVKQVETVEGPAAVSVPVGESYRTKEVVKSAEPSKAGGEVVASEAPVSNKAFDTLKNMVDKIADRLNIEGPALHKWDKIIIAIASFACALGIADLIILLVKIA